VTDAAGERVLFEVRASPQLLALHRRLTIWKIAFSLFPLDIAPWVVRTPPRPLA
jgi:hypothetical protein